MGQRRRAINVSTTETGGVSAIAFPPEPGDQQSYGYDQVDRLASAILGNAGLSFSYVYDANGNRLQELRNGASSQYTTAGTSNRLQGDQRCDDPHHDL
jgi:YD repeat-containing protein